MKAPKDTLGKVYGKMIKKDQKSNKHLINKLIVKAPKVKPKIK